MFLEGWSMSAKSRISLLPSELPPQLQIQIRLRRRSDLLVTAADDGTVEIIGNAMVGRDIPTSSHVSLVSDITLTPRQTLILEF